MTKAELDALREEVKTSEENLKKEEEDFQTVVNETQAAHLVIMGKQKELAEKKANLDLEEAKALLNPSEEEAPAAEPPAEPAPNPFGQL